MYYGVHVTVTWETSADPCSWANFALKPTGILPLLPRSRTRAVSLEFLTWHHLIQDNLLWGSETRLLHPDHALIRNLVKTLIFCKIPRTLFYNSSSARQAAITLVHFGLRFTFFLQLAQMLTHCMLSSFGQIVFIFSQHSNPNRRFHLFSFRESVFSGIFSGSEIVWKGVSCFALLLLLLLLHPVWGAHRS